VITPVLSRQHGSAVRDDSFVAFHEYRRRRVVFPAVRPTGLLSFSPTAHRCSSGMEFDGGAVQAAKDRGNYPGFGTSHLFPTPDRVAAERNNYYSHM
jgi:hypothetical protein